MQRHERQVDSRCSIRWRGTIKCVDGHHNPGTVTLVNKGRQEDCEMCFEGTYIRPTLRLPPPSPHSSSRSTPLSFRFAPTFPGIDGLTRICNGNDDVSWFLKARLRVTWQRRVSQTFSFPLASFTNTSWLPIKYSQRVGIYYFTKHKYFSNITFPFARKI